MEGMDTPVCSYLFFEEAYRKYSWLSGDVEAGAFHSGRRPGDPPFHSLQGATWCRYCESDLAVISQQTEDVSRYESIPTSTFACLRCGWWLVQVRDNLNDKLSCEQVLGVAKRYPVDSVDVPIEALRDYLCRHPHDLASVASRQFELLMQSCFADAYAPC